MPDLKGEQPWEAGDAPETCPSTLGRNPALGRSGAWPEPQYNSLAGLIDSNPRFGGWLKFAKLFMQSSSQAALECPMEFWLCA